MSSDNTRFFQFKRMNVGRNCCYFYYYYWYLYNRLFFSSQIPVWIFFSRLYIFPTKYGYKHYSFQQNIIPMYIIIPERYCSFEISLLYLAKIVRKNNI